MRPKPGHPVTPQSPSVARADLPPLRLFVYGTLKQGERNHDRFCLGAATIEQAWTTGKLHRLVSGLLMLEVAPHCLLVTGTADHDRDLRTQEEIGATLPVLPKTTPQTLPPVASQTLPQILRTDIQPVLPQVATSTPQSAFPPVLPLADGQASLRDFHETPGSPRGSHTHPKNTQTSTNTPIPGELMTFPDGPDLLRRLDPFEGFHPGGQSFYRRLLVPVWTEQGVTPAWVYGR